MEHLLQKSKGSISHNIFKYIIFQRHQKALIWSEGLTQDYIINTEYHIQPNKHKCSYKHTLSTAQFLYIAQLAKQM